MLFAADESKFVPDAAADSKFEPVAELERMLWSFNDADELLSDARGS